MSQFYNVFGRLGTGLTRAEIVAFANDSWYGDDPVTASIPGNPDDEDWTGMELTVPGVARPFGLERNTSRDEVAVFVREAIDEWDPPADVRSALSTSDCVIGVEVFPDDLDSDARELLDLLLALLARRLDGYVVADDGVFDRELNKL